MCGTTRYVRFDLPLLDIDSKNWHEKRNCGHKQFKTKQKMVLKA